MSEINSMSDADRKLYFDQVFGMLKEHVGKNVTCIYWEFGEMNGYRGILEDVVPYDFINIEGQVINFVGERTAIQYVILQENNVLYSVFNNPDVIEYRGSFRDPMQVIEAQKRFLGHSVTELEMQERAKNR